MNRVGQTVKQFLVEYSMLLVLLGLCLFFSVATLDTQIPTGRHGAEQLLHRMREITGSGGTILLVAKSSPEDREFASFIREEGGFSDAQVIVVDGDSPRVVRAEFEDRAKNGSVASAIVGTRSVSHWSLLLDRGEKYPPWADVPLIFPRKATSSNFLTSGNLKNVAEQSAVIAIIAIGMTLVIITGGIDLSVGSLVALSAVTAAMAMRDFFGGTDAGWGGMCAAVGVAVCLAALVGTLSGGMITWFGMPPFIVTLATMSIARGLAQILAKGQSVYQVPESFSWLAGGKPLGVPNEVVVMLVLYVAAHLIMTKTTLGRWFYAVGSNREAARLSGVPVALVLMIAYVVSAALAGVGGVLEASRLKSGSPLYGVMLELDVITAVVVGGTSLAGGEGKIFGTLCGALAIAVIRNGMNLMNIESYTQGVVMGSLILLAVFVDSLKKGQFVALVRRISARH
ncbi:MAG: ABC transporter permease [Pirellulales bacterium]|nr:ABC transporter permease [Pirellulales bacterium]